MKPKAKIRPRVVHLRSTPETVIWGWIAADRQPVLRVKSGQAVRIDTVSHQGLNTDRDPIAFFGAAGIARGAVLEDASSIHRGVKRGEGAGPHILTGPVHVEGARPGDMLEVRVLDVAIRVPYGVNATGPGRGAVPDLLGEAAQKVIRLDLGRGVARLDYNRNARPDLVVVHQDRPVALLKNETQDAGRAVVLELRGVQSNRDAVGAKIRLSAGGRTQHVQILGGDGYFATNERIQTIAVGDAAVIDWLEITWPAGASQRWTDLPTDHRLVCVEGQRLLVEPIRPEAGHAAALWNR